MNNHLFECSLGFHEYTIPSKSNPKILICKYCKKYGHCERDNECWTEYTEYDDNGNCIYCKNINGAEYWMEYDNKGNCIYYKNSYGKEGWFHRSKWVTKKPKNWNLTKEKING